jgi:hypothetical protein
MLRTGSALTRPSGVHPCCPAPVLSCAIVLAAAVLSPRTGESEPLLRAQLAAFDVGVDVHCASMAAADMNGDGWLDIVALGDHSVSVLLGNGDGSAGRMS